MKLKDVISKESQNPEFMAFLEKWTEVIAVDPAAHAAGLSDMIWEFLPGKTYRASIHATKKNKTLEVYGALYLTIDGDTQTLQTFPNKCCITHMMCDLQNFAFANWKGFMACTPNPKSKWSMH